MTDYAKQTSALLSLPAELRNCVYRYVLVAGSRLIVDTPEAVRQPALLRTCSQIRKEALNLYYADNSFEIVMHDCDSDILHAFCKASLTRESIKATITDTGRINWANLLVWLQRIHAGSAASVLGARPSRARNGTNEVFAATLEIAYQLHDLPWKRVLPLVEMQRADLARLEPQWF